VAAAAAAQGESAERCPWCRRTGTATMKALILVGGFGTCLGPLIC
jgi:hypothetical protein